MDTPTDNSPRHGFSIAALLLLTAVAAIALAAAQTTRQTVDKLDRTHPQIYFWASPQPSLFDRRVEELAWKAVAGALIGTLVGIGIGVTRPRPVLATLLAIPVGVFAGATTGALLTEAENVLVVVIGSLLLILFGVAIRALSRHPR